MARNGVSAGFRIDGGSGTDHSRHHRQ